MTDDDVRQEHMNGGELVYRAVDPEHLRFREEGEQPPILEGRLMPYNEWTEVRSPIEGHFLERFAPGSLAKTMTEQASRIRVMFEHGMDSVFGKQAIAAVDEMRDEHDGGYYRASLLQGVPDLLVSGLRRGLYGSSIRFAPVKWDRVTSPKPSEYNPDGLPEHTIREAFMKEFSVVPFPQYAGATASVRSMTDEIAAKQLMADPEKLLEVIRAAAGMVPATTTEEDPEPPQSPAPDTDDSEPERTRATQPTRDYLSQKEEAPTWRL